MTTLAFVVVYATVGDEQWAKKAPEFPGLCVWSSSVGDKWSGSDWRLSISQYTGTPIGPSLITMKLNGMVERAYQFYVVTMMLWSKDLQYVYRSKLLLIHTVNRPLVSPSPPHVPAPPVIARAASWSDRDRRKETLAGVSRPTSRGI